MQFKIKFRQIILFFLLNMLTTSFVFADVETGLGKVFIQTVPINASIIVDGEPILQKSPALLKDIKQGTKKIGIRKEGYKPLDFVIEIDKAGTSLIDVSLLNSNVEISFPGTEKVVLNSGGITSEHKNTLSIQQGSYQIKNDEGSLMVKPVYDKEKFFYISTGLFFLSTASAIIAGIIEYNNRGEVFFPHSTALTVFESVALVTGLTDVALLLDRNEYFENIYVDDKPTFQETEAKLIFDEARKNLYEDEMEDALTNFVKIISNYPDYERFPEALYTVSRIHLINGEYSLAASELRIIINDYPDVRVYDKACQKLAIIYYKAGQIEKSIETVSNMVFYDPIFEDVPADIASKGIESVLKEWVGLPLKGDYE